MPEPHFPDSRPRTAFPPDVSFYEIPPSGSDYLDRMTSLIARLVPGYGSVAEVGSPSGDLCRRLRERSPVTAAETGAGSHDLLLTCEAGLAPSDARKWPAP